MMPDMEESPSNAKVCPICDNELEDAIAVVDSGLLPNLWFSPFLKFRRRKGKKWIRYLSIWKSTQALHCKHCGALVLAPSDREHLKLIQGK